MNTKPQNMQALDRANEIRLTRARAKERVARRETTVSELLDGDHSPLWYLLTCPIGDLLRSQPRWGGRRVRKFVHECGVLNEETPIEKIPPTQLETIVRKLRERGL